MNRLKIKSILYEPGADTANVVLIHNGSVPFIQNRAELPKNLTDFPEGYIILDISEKIIYLYTNNRFLHIRIDYIQSVDDKYRDTLNGLNTQHEISFKIQTDMLDTLRHIVDNSTNLNNPKWLGVKDVEDANHK